MLAAAAPAAIGTAPAGTEPQDGACLGLPAEPAAYWGDEAWRQIEPSYGAAAAALPADDGGPCWDVDGAIALPLTLLAALAGVALIGVAAAAGRRRPVLGALAAVVPVAVLWFVVLLLRGLSRLA